MSSTLSFPWKSPPSLRALVMKLHMMAEAPVEVTDAEEWPEGGALFWLPGVSARGVQLLPHEGGVTLRIPAHGSLGDFQFACFLAEYFATGEVEIDGHDPCPAEAVKEEHDEWYVRESAVAVTALRWALDQGNTVTINGPKYAVEIKSDSGIDLTTVAEVLRQAHED